MMHATQQQQQQHSPSTLSPSAPTRNVHCCDALSWLGSQPVLQGCSFITSFPDISELRIPGQQTHSLSVADYSSWFISAAQLLLSRCPDDGVAIFFQTDIKVDGTWLDKGYLAQRAAEETGHALLWNKVVCRVAPGTATFGRPGYHHMLCFSKGVRAAPAAAATADVLPCAGDTTWARGMGTAACAAACRFVRDHTATHTVVDPFCGHGTVLAVANQLGLHAVGVELSPKRVKKALALAAAGAGLQHSRGSSSHKQQRQQGRERQQQQQQAQVQRQEQQAEVQRQDQQRQQQRQAPGGSKPQQPQGQLQRAAQSDVACTISSEAQNT